MNIVRFHIPGHEHTWLGWLDGETCHATGQFGQNLPTSMVEVIRHFDECQPASNAMPTFARDEIILLPPVDHPQKIICVGQNYADHAREMGSAVPELPVIFNKFPTSLAGPAATVTLPAISNSVDYEAELVAVIGRQCKNVAVEQAMQCVFGFCCGNDISARDWQKGKPGGQWLLGKTFDGFAPVGPWLVRNPDIDPHTLNIRLQLNGETMQQSHTENLIFPVEVLVAHVSRFCTLSPGDLLFTGTPAGVGAGRTPPRFLQPGDETVVEIDGLGQLKTQFVAE